MRVNAEITQGNASHDNLDGTKEAEDEGVDVFADDEDDADTCTTRSGSSAVSSHNPASDRNGSLSELPDGQHDSLQSSQPGLTVASLEKSDLTNAPLPRHRPRQDDTKNVCRKRPRTPALTGPVRTTSPVSTAPESNYFEHTQPVARLTAPAQERECDTDQEMSNDEGSSSDSNDEDYCDVGDAASSKVRGRPPIRKRVRRAKDIERNGIGTPSIQALNISYQAVAATSPNMHESEEIPIHGSLTLKTVGSRVIYCLTFSQEVIPESGGASQR